MDGRDLTARDDAGDAVTARPLIGVICCARLVGDDPGTLVPGQMVVDRYLRAVIEHADADAVLIPALPDLQDARRVLARLDGVVLTGSPSNVQPALYGSHDPGEGPSDPARDATMLALVSEAAERARPLLGICRGLQEVNVALGGTLRRDFAAPGRALAHHAPPGSDEAAMFAFGHAVTPTPGGVLARLYGPAPLRVNSAHFQGIDRLAPALVAEAQAPDGAIEAVRAPGAPLLAVQWHPEWRPVETGAVPLLRMFGAVLRGATLEAAADASRPIPRRAETMPR